MRSWPEPEALPPRLDRMSVDYKETLMVRAWLVGVALLGFSAVGLANDPLVVHEWGTFTALQDEQGRAGANQYR